MRNRPPSKGVPVGPSISACTSVSSCSFSCTRMPSQGLDCRSTSSLVSLRKTVADSSMAILFSQHNALRAAACSFRSQRYSLMNSGFKHGATNTTQVWTEEKGPTKQHNNLMSVMHMHAARA